jgi:hypothetical protein
VDSIELHNVQHYLEHDFLRRTYSEEKRDVAEVSVPLIRSTVAGFFSTIDDTACASVITDIDYDYHADAVELLGRNELDPIRSAGADDRSVPRRRRSTRR